MAPRRISPRKRLEQTLHRLGQIPILGQSRQKKRGLAPGTLVHIGRHTTEPIVISALEYGSGHFEERTLAGVEEAAALRDSDRISWINIYGIHDVEVVRRVGEIFDLHPLLLEDVVNTEQRPKYEEYEDYGFFVLKMISWTDDHKLSVEQISMVLGKTWVLCFQERPGDVLDHIRHRVRTGKRIQQRGPDYLVYAIVDTVVDAYFDVLESVGTRIEDLELTILNNPSPALLAELQILKRDTITLRKAMWPVRDIIYQLERGETKHISPETLVYLRDVQDHAVQVIDMVQIYREMMGSLLEIYMSSQSNKMNQIMKVLTIISTIFIPLTFLAGVYGMNFRHMPELEWRYGYFLVWGVMIAIGVGLLALFRKRHWL